MPWAFRYAPKNRLTGRRASGRKCAWPAEVRCGRKPIALIKAASPPSRKREAVRCVRSATNGTTRATPHYQRDPSTRRPVAIFLKHDGSRRKGSHRKLAVPATHAVRDRGGYLDELRADSRCAVVRARAGGSSPVDACGRRHQQLPMVVLV